MAREPSTEDVHGEAIAGDRRPHIAIIGHQAGDQIFGAERSLLDVLAAVDPRQFRLSCILPAQSEVYLQAVARHTGDITVFPYRAWSRLRPFQAETIQRFEQIFRQGQVDLAHVNTITLQAPLLAARRLGLARIVHARELVDQDRYLTWRFVMAPAGVVRRVQRTADVILANSQATQKLYDSGKQCRLLYNCVDTARLDIANDLAPGRLKVGIISSNTPKKGIGFFVELAIAAAQRLPDVEFFVIGPRTAYVERLMRKLPRLARPARLHVIDYMADPVDALRLVNVIVSCSLVAESFGRTIAEAMAARRPVIAFDKGATSELIRDGIDGFITPSGDIAAALDHLENLATHPELIRAMGASGRSRAQQMFSAETFARNLNEIYRQTLAQRPHRMNRYADPSSGSSGSEQMVKVSSP
jgi:glycosyltransferase involved in cell wall biosynthesis